MFINLVNWGLKVLLGLKIKFMFNLNQTIENNSKKEKILVLCILLTKEDRYSISYWSTDDLLWELCLCSFISSKSQIDGIALISQYFFSVDKTGSAVALMATVLECLKGAMVKQNVPMTTLMNLVVPYSAMMIPTMPNIIQRMVIWVVKFPKEGYKITSICDLNQHTI